MRYIRKTIILIACFLPLACGTAEKDLYHYTPQNAGEIPAILNCKVVTFSDSVMGIATVSGAAVDKINGKTVKRFISAQETRSLSLSPGLNTITVKAAGRYARGTEANLFFDAKPGENYFFNGSGSVGEFSVWIEDRSGKRLASQGFNIRR